jgi:carbon monoxide dehydrogenase subunit G
MPARRRLEGGGGPAGFAKGEAAVRLHEQGATTRLAYSVKAQVTGPL